jgi:hypothetical protein
MKTAGLGRIINIGGANARDPGNIRSDRARRRFIPDHAWAGLNFGETFDARYAGFAPLRSRHRRRF